MVVVFMPALGRGKGPETVDEDSLVSREAEVNFKYHIAARHEWPSLGEDVGVEDVLAESNTLLPIART